VKHQSIILLSALLALTACDQNKQTMTPVTTSSKTPVTTAALDSDEAGAYTAQLGLRAYTSYSTAAQKAQALDSRLQSYLYHPNPMSLAEVQQAWRDAYSAYLQTLVFTYLPINDPPDWFKQNIDLQHTMMLLDSWPIEGGYIDYLPGYPFSGIVNDLTLELNEESMLAQHGFSDPSYASLGYHAYEFMLWGADGKRSPRDFFPQENSAPVVIPSEGGHIADDAAQTAGESGDVAEAGTAALAVEVQNHNRRRQYTQLVSEQVQKHLHRLQRRWEPSNGYYATLVQRSEPQQVVAATLMAAQSLLSEELLGKRLQGNSSEFSQTTSQDIGALTEGIRQLFLASTDDLPSGLSLLLPDDAGAPLQQEWQDRFVAIESALQAWSEGDNQSNRQQCRERLIELMSVVKKTASQLNIPLAGD
jgi:putative iron-regulated protein